MNQENKLGCGAVFLCKNTGRILYNLRSESKTHSLCWGFWGGMAEGDETPKECLHREFTEEMGFIPNIERIYPFDVYQSKDKHFKYLSFICLVNDEFTPILNSESDGYAWIKLGIYPKPMHMGARATLCSSSALTKLEFILSQH